MKEAASWLRGALLITSTLLAGWLGLQITHELGHVLHAMVSGGRVECVYIPVLGFSRTDLASNPHPVFVAWGGFIWGVIIPWALLGLANTFTSPAARPLRGFLAAALIGNGIYACSRVGDVEDILRSGGARWPLVLWGIALILCGLFMLERFVNATPLRATCEVSWRYAAGMAAVAGILMAIAAFSW
jgi:hypothetical protein